MRVTVVGCSGSYPGPDSCASSYLVEAEGEGADGSRTWRILLDFGNGALGQLHRYADPLAVDAVLLSHLHPDHCMDLCGYYVMRKYHPDGPQPQIPVWGPSDAADRMARAYDLPVDPGMTEEFDFRTYAAGVVEVGPFRIEAIGVDHPVEAFGLRVGADGVTLGYSGDTAVCEGLDRVASGVDLLLAEASFRDGDDNPPHVHLTGLEAGQVATRAGVGRLVLTHVPPWFDKDAMVAEASSAFGGPVGLASAGAVYEL